MVEEHKNIINCINDLLKLQVCKIRQFIAVNCALTEDSSTVSGIEIMEIKTQQT